MKRITDFLKKQSTLATALLSLIGVIIGIFIENPELVAALTGVIAALIGIRQVVTPVSTMVEKVTEATTIAATQVAHDLGRNTVGAIGEVSDAGTQIVDSVIDNTLGQVLDLRDKNGNGYERVGIN